PTIANRKQPELHRLAPILVWHSLLGYNASRRQFERRDLAHAELLHLARDCQGESVHELPVAWNLKVCDATGTRGSKVFGGKRGAGLGPDPGHDLFAVALAGYADHMGLGDTGNCVQKLLDFARVNVLPAADDDVLDPADDEDISVVVHRGEVARVHPPGRVDGVRGGFWVVPVAEHDVIAAHALLT